MIIGYARVSTPEQSLELQHDALKHAGAERIFDDQASGVAKERVGLTAALDFVREGDTLVVWRLDRLGRSMRDLIDRVTDLERRGVNFKSLNENIDTATAGGRLFFHVFAALAEFERELIRERTYAGLAAARARGRRGGRPIALTPRKLAQARAMWASTELTVEEIVEAVGVSRSVLYREFGPRPIRKTDGGATA